MNNAIDVLIALASLDFEKVAEVTDNEGRIRWTRYRTQHAQAGT